MPTTALSNDGADDVYPPSEDTHLLIRALREDADSFLKRGGRSCMVLEIGIGNGAVTEAIRHAHRCYVFGVDVNMSALSHCSDRMDCKATRDHGIVELIRGDLLTWLAGPCTKAMRGNPLPARPFAGMFDIIVFNPPYVPTDQEEMERAREKMDIFASWAGGTNGREVIDRVLPQVSNALASDGVFYLVVEQANGIEDVLHVAGLYGLKGEVTCRMTAGRERLVVLRLQCADSDERIDELAALQS